MRNLLEFLAKYNHWFLFVILVSYQPDAAVQTSTAIRARVLLVGQIAGNRKGIRMGRCSEDILQPDKDKPATQYAQPLSRADSKEAV